MEKINNPFYGVRAKSALMNFINVGIDDIMLIEGPIRIITVIDGDVNKFLDLSDYEPDSLTAKFFQNKWINKILLGEDPDIWPERFLLNETRGIAAIKFGSKNEQVDNFFIIKTKKYGLSFIIQLVDDDSHFYEARSEEHKFSVMPRSCSHY